MDSTFYSKGMAEETCPWPGVKMISLNLSYNTGVGSHSLLQGIFLTQGSNLGLLHCRWTLYYLSHQGSLIRMNDSLEKLLPTAQGHTSISELEAVHLTRFNHHLQKQCLLTVEIPSI